MQVKSIKKKKNTYQVQIDELLYDIEVDVLLEFRLRKSLILDQKTFNDLMIQNKLVYIKRKAIMYVTKSRTVRDFKAYLRTLEADENYIDSLTKQFKDKKYLDDHEYAINYVLSLKSRYGKNKIRQSLVEKGIKKEIIDSVLEDFKSDNLEDMIKKDSKLIKKDTYLKAKETLYRRYIQKGFEESLVSALIDKHLDKTRFNENITIEKYFLNALKKYQHKYENQELKQKIYLYLRQKGFNPNQIKDIIEKREW